MDFAICPVGGPPRLLRRGVLPKGVIAQLDKSTNVLTVDIIRFDLLTLAEQERVLRTQELEIRDEGKYIAAAA